MSRAWAPFEHQFENIKEMEFKLTQETQECRILTEMSVNEGYNWVCRLEFVNPPGSFTLLDCSQQ